MEENQRTSSKSNRRKKKKSGGLGEKSEEQNNVEEQLPSQQQHPKPLKQPAAQTQLQSDQRHEPKQQKQPLAEKQPHSQSEQSKPRKQPKSPKQSQTEQNPSIEKESSQEKQPQTDKKPKSKKQPKQTQPPAVAHLEDPTQLKDTTRSEDTTQPTPFKQSLKEKQREITHLQTVPQPQAITRPQSVTQSAPAKQSSKQKRQTVTQHRDVTHVQTGMLPEVVSQSQPVTEHAPAKQSLQTVTQPQAVTQSQVLTQLPSKESLQKKHSAEKRPSPDKELPNRPVFESNRQSVERGQFLSSESKAENLSAEVQTSRIPEQEHTAANAVGSKCVPFGDTAPSEVTAGAAITGGRDVTDATCARNASVSITSAATVQITMTGRTDKTEGRPGINKTREDIEAERKLRKAAKQAKKVKKPDEAPKDVQKVVESVEKLKVDEKVETPKDSKEKSSQPKEEVKKSAEGEATEKQPAEGGKSKAELRAERRAIQEAQRAAKAAGKDAKVLKEKQQQQPVQVAADEASAAASEGIPSKTKTSSEAKSAERRVKLFSHLYQRSFNNISQSLKVNHPLYHPAIVRLGVQYSERIVLGSNARCVALLEALKHVIADYETPPEKEFGRGLEAYLQPNVEFLEQCRPSAVSMTNALRLVKRQLTALPNNIKDSQARPKLHDYIETYIKDQIETAAEAIGITAEKKIADGDVVLVYACSSLVLQALKMTHAKGKKFRVIVVDSLPWLEGREMLRRLVCVGIKCTYVHISAASFIMREVTKVFLGAHALLANGYVMSRAGSSQIALIARAYNVPVLVCCETHKFSERVQMDSFVYNELGNPDELVGKKKNDGDSENQSFPLENWRDLPHLSLLNLVYDVTPPDLVTAVVTELAILPCTSVPVVLRIKPTDC